MSNVISTTNVTERDVTSDVVNTTVQTPQRQAYEILHWGFVAAPVIAGLDKFTQILANWDAYLAPPIANIFGDALGAHSFMLVVGVIEIAAGLLVAIRPRIGAYVVAGWLAAIILNLLIGVHHLDVALRDLGLCLGALALGRLAQVYDVRRKVLPNRTHHTHVAAP